MKVRRYFHEAQYAESMADGEFRISTLSACRGYEDANRGDPNEGSTSYNTGALTGAHPNARALARMAGIHLAGEGQLSEHVVLSNNTFVTKIYDGYVICMAHQPITDADTLRTFGRYYVEISDVDLFSHRVGKTLERELSMVFEHSRGPISYNGHAHVGDGPSPGRIAFVKDPRYRPQHEYRALWVGNRSHKYEVRSIVVPRVAELCKVDMVR